MCVQGIGSIVGGKYMLKVEAIAKVHYTCTLSDEEEEKVIGHIKGNPDEFGFMSAKKAILQAVEELYENEEIDLYKNAVESDYYSDDIAWSEFERRRPEDILG